MYPKILSNTLKQQTVFDFLLSYWFYLFFTVIIESNRICSNNLIFCYFKVFSYILITEIIIDIIHLKKGFLDNLIFLGVYSYIIILMFVYI